MLELCLSLPFLYHEMFLVNGIQIERLSPIVFIFYTLSVVILDLKSLMPLFYVIYYNICILFPILCFFIYGKKRNALTKKRSLFNYLKNIYIHFCPILFLQGVRIKYYHVIMSYFFLGLYYGIKKNRLQCIYGNTIGHRDFKLLLTIGSCIHIHLFYLLVCEGIVEKK